MMKQAKIMIINLEKMEFKNKETGEVRIMTKITYAIDMSTLEKLKGCAILVCYSNSKTFDMLEKYIMKFATADIEERPTSNGSKYVLVKINGEKLI